MNKDMIKEAAKPKNIWIWRKVYNALCRSCQQKLFHLITDTKGDPDKVKEFVNNKLCTVCKNRAERITGGK